MAYTLSKLKGTNASMLKALKAEKITNADHLLAAAKSPSNRKDLAKATGLKEKDILELANRADLSRVKGVAGVFSDLLENAGVDTVKELATRRADNLHEKMVEVNTKKGFAKRAPNMSEVESWVKQAKALPKMLTY